MRVSDQFDEFVEPSLFDAVKPEELEASVDETDPDQDDVPDHESEDSPGDFEDRVATARVGRAMESAERGAKYDSSPALRLTDHGVWEQAGVTDPAVRITLRDASLYAKPAFPAVRAEALVGEDGAHASLLDSGRLLLWRKTRRPVWAFVSFLPEMDSSWRETTGGMSSRVMACTA